MRRVFFIAGMVLLMSGIPLHAATKAPPTESISSLPDEDSDGDGLTNQEEAGRGTMPANPDSDNDGLVDGNDAVAKNPALKVPAAPESGYAIIDLGTGSTPVGINDNAEVLLLEPTGGNGLRAGSLWKNGAPTVVGEGGFFRGPLEDGSVYFAGAPDSNYDIDLYGVVCTTSRKKMIWNPAWFPAAVEWGVFQEEKIWTSPFPYPIPLTPPASDILQSAAATRYASEWSTAMTQVNLAFTRASPINGWTKLTTNLGAFNDWHDQSFEMLLDSTAYEQRFFSGAYYDVPIYTHLENVGVMSLNDSYSFDTGGISCKWPMPPDNYDALNAKLWRNLLVNVDPLALAIAVVDTHPVVIRKSSGLPDVPLPNATDIVDINMSTTTEGPYILGTNSGQPTIWCYNSGQPQAQAIAGTIQPFGADDKVVSRKISNSLVIPAGAGIWRNGRLLPMAKLNASADDLYSGWNIRYVSPMKNFLLGSATSNVDGQEHATLLIPADLAVDANRDGVIAFAGNMVAGKPADKTTKTKPFRFWINDDNDTHNENGGEDVVPVLFPDSEDDEINSLRDLEDFARLYVHIGAFYEEIATGTFQIGLKWSGNVMGTPKVKVYKSADAAGSDSYLKDDAAATAQVAEDYRNAIGEVAGSAPLILPAELFAAYGEANPKVCLLFEGSGEGKGQLCITIHKADGTLIGEGPGVWLDLLNVKKMYQRGHAVQDFSDTPFAHMDSWSPPAIGSQPYDNGNPFSKPVDEEKKVVVYVHGINGPSGQSDAYATWQSDSETVFKRLWHQGFKGRFAAFKWLALTPAWPFKFNESEYRGWKCGQGLAQFINTLPDANDYKKNLYSFSQGAIVCGAALTVYQASVSNYVMTQAAAPAGSYDSTSAINSYTDFLNAETTSPTPDATNDLGYRGYLSGLSVTGSVVSFFNQVDYALKAGRELGINVSWEGNQLMSKPNQNLSGRTYAYDAGPPSNPYAIGARCFLRDVGLPFNERRLTDIHESMSFVARPRSEAAGASNAVGGKIGSRYNVGEGSSSNFGRSSSDHGGQFSRRIQNTQDYYRELGVRLGVLTLQQ